MKRYEHKEYMLNLGTGCASTMYRKKNGKYVRHDEAQAEIDAQRKYWIKIFDEIRSDKQAEIDELVDMLEMLMSSGLMENETQGYTYCEVTDEEYKTSLALIAKHKGE